MGFFRARFAISAFAILIFSLAAGADVTMSGWYFPQPYTMDSPMSPYRSGAMDFSFAFCSNGWAVAFPLHSSITNEKENFIVDLGFPMAIGNITNSGKPDFYAGNIKVGVRGAFKFNFPISREFNLPAAWGVGVDVVIPLAAIWGTNDASLYSNWIYLHDPVAWDPHAFGLSPKGIFAIGKPIFFFETELQLPSLILIKGNAASSPWLLQWGATLGSQPIDLVAALVELGGLFTMVNYNSSLQSTRNHVWMALGARFYFSNGLTTGLTLRIPFVHDYSGISEPVIGFILTVGFERRQPKEF